LTTSYAAGEIILADHFHLMGCTLRRGGQTLNDAVDTTVSWDTEDVDTDNLWTIGSPTVITIPETGLWAIAFSIVRAAPTTGRSLVDVVTSAAPWNTVSSLLRSSWQPNEDFCSGSFTIPLTAGNTFTIRVNADGSGNSTMTAALTCYRVNGGA